MFGNVVIGLLLTSVVALVFLFLRLRRKNAGSNFVCRSYQRRSDEAELL